MNMQPIVLGLPQGRQGAHEEAAARDPRERRQRRQLRGRGQDHRDAQPPARCALRWCHVDVRVGPVRTRATRHPLRPAEDTDRSAHLQCAGLHALAVTSGDPQQPQGEERAAEWNDGGQGDQLRHVTQAEAQDVTSATLWMTPEIIRGEVYSTDADMFSFSVVLSELDMLSDPYAQARQQICDSSRCPLQEADILQKVTQGSLRVVFFESGPMALAELRFHYSPIEIPAEYDSFGSVQQAL
ncbi:hypothetical protein ON010_g8647 [Phytophthora cinnamomi]|nr:hypothetical protein ON010_g8647 [Phytophthora cinnamomi]